MGPGWMNEGSIESSWRRDRMITALAKAASIGASPFPWPITVEAPEFPVDVAKSAALRASSVLQPSIDTARS